MKKLSLLIISGLASLALSNCTPQTGPNTKRGATAGGLMGAVAGGINLATPLKALRLAVLPVPVPVLFTVMIRIKKPTHAATDSYLG